MLDDESRELLERLRILGGRGDRSYEWWFFAFAHCDNYADLNRVKTELKERLKTL